MTPYLRAPVRGSLAGDAVLSLPAAGGALILQDVDTINREQQQQLLQWLDDPRNGQTQLISITATPLYALVQAGTFLDRLYYYLNVIQFDLTHD